MVIFQCLVKNYKVSGGVGWHMPPIPAPRKQRQKDQEFKVIFRFLGISVQTGLRGEGEREGGRMKMFHHA